MPIGAVVAYSATPLSSNHRPPISTSRAPPSEDLLNLSDGSNSISRAPPSEDQLTLSDRFRRASENNVQARNTYFLESAAFNVPVTVLILANTIQLGMSADLTGQHWQRTWEVANYVFTACFTLEFILKVGILKLGYFKNRWNWLDFGLVLLAFLEIAMGQMQLGARLLKNSSLIRTLRLLRLARVLKMVSAFRELRILTDAIIKAMRTMTWIVLLVCLVVYVFSIFCTETIGRDESFPDYNDDPAALTAANFNNHQYFGSLWRSMLTCFSLITLSEWSTVTRPIAEHQPMFLLCLVAFVMLTAFGIMNVIIGIMAQHAVDAALQAGETRAEHYRKEQIVFLNAVEKIVANADADHNGQIEFKEFQEAVNADPTLAFLMMRADLPDNFSVKELFTLLDVDGDGVLTSREFHKEMYRLVYCNDFQRICIMQSSLNKIKQQISSVSRGLFGKSKLSSSISCMSLDGSPRPLESAPLDLASILSNLQDEMKVLRSEVQENLAQLNCPATKCMQQKEGTVWMERSDPQGGMPPMGPPGSGTPEFYVDPCQHNMEQAATDPTLEFAFKILQESVAQTIDECLRSTTQKLRENRLSANLSQQGTSCQYDGIVPRDQHTVVSQEKTENWTRGCQEKKGSDFIMEPRSSRFPL